MNKTIHQGQLVKELLFKHVARSIEAIEKKAPFTMPQLISIFNSPTVTPREIREFNTAFNIDLHELIARYKRLGQPESQESVEADDNGKVVGDVEATPDHAPTIDRAIPPAATHSKVVSIAMSLQENNNEGNNEKIKTEIIIDLLHEQLANQQKMIFHYEEIIASSSKIIELLQSQLATELSKQREMGDTKLG